MPHVFRIAFVCALASLWGVGCGETGGTPPSDGGTAGTDAGGGTGGEGGTAGGVGTGGEGGSGGTVDLCAGVDCSDHRECTIDHSCNPDTGGCEGGSNKLVDTPCGGGSHFCNGSGDCVGCNRSEQCPDDGNQCTTGFCAGTACVTVHAGGPCDCLYDDMQRDTSCNEDGGRFCDGSGSCVECSQASQCSDGNPCTVDLCRGSPPQCTHVAAQNGSLCSTAPSICIDSQCVFDSLGHEIYSGDRGDLAAGVHTIKPDFYRWGLAGFYATAGEDTAVFARYEDQSSNDDFSWRIDAQRLPYGSTRHVATGCQDNGADVNGPIGPIPYDKVPVLLGFDLDRDTDHNLETIGIYLFIDGAGRLNLTRIFEDERSVGDRYCYRVDYALVPLNRVRAQWHLVETVHRTGSHTVAIGARPVLQGFRMEFQNGDHHIDRLGMRLDPGVLTVWFNDQNDDYPFLWQVWYADLE